MTGQGQWRQIGLEMSKDGKESDESAFQRGGILDRERRWRRWGIQLSFNGGGDKIKQIVISLFDCLIL